MVIDPPDEMVCDFLVEAGDVLDRPGERRVNLECHLDRHRLPTCLDADSREYARAPQTRGAEPRVQDRNACADYGMPRTVTREGLADWVLPLAATGAALRQAA